MLLAKSGVIPLEIERMGSRHPLVYALIRKKHPLDLEEDCFHWLNPDELEILEELSSPKKRGSFLLGRYTAKLSLASFLHNRDMLSCSVTRGVLGQPVVQSDIREVPEISLAHSGQYGASICFPPGHQFGLDVEEIRSAPTRIAAISSKMTEKERSLLEELKEQVSEEKLYYLIWTLKEALSKVLRCGLTLPLEALELRDLEWKEDQLLGRFTHFTQYRGFSQCSDDLAIALVFPWKSRIVIPEGARP